jgi:hypothetical protein
LLRSGNSESISLFKQVGNFSNVSRNHAAGSRPLSFAVPSNVCIAAARLPARSEPVNNQFFFISFAADKKNYLQSVIMRSVNFLRGAEALRMSS